MRGFAFDFALLAAVYALVYAMYLRRREARYRVWFTLFYVYVSLVLAVTLMPFQIPLPAEHGLSLEELNLEPFRDVKRGYLGAVCGVVLNGVMFLPMGFLPPTLRPRGFLRTVLAGFLASLAIESVQLLYCLGPELNRRIFDVTDLIMNTAGAAAGYALFRLARPVIALFDPAVPIKQKRKRTA